MVNTKHKTMREKRLLLRKWFFSTTARLTLVAVIAIFGVLYVIQTGFASAKGYEIRDLENQIQSLSQENERLEFEIANHRSMKSIQERLQTMNLVAVDNVEYVSLPGSAVALR